MSIKERTDEQSVGIRRVNVTWIDGKPSGLFEGIAATLEQIDHEKAARELLEQGLKWIGYVDAPAEIVKYNVYQVWDDGAGCPTVPEITVTFKGV